MKGIVPYFCGKSRLARTIIDKMPMHGCYVEVFAGGASVFFQKPPSNSEVINDLDKDLVTLYRSVKNHPEELYRQFKFSLVSRVEFEREQKVAAETLTDIQRAARYLYLQKTAFGGKIVGQTYGTATTGKPRLNILNLESTLEQAWQRLAQVQIECLDFRNLIQKYDREHTFFFLDPPYWNIPEIRKKQQKNSYQLILVKNKNLLIIKIYDSSAT